MTAPERLVARPQRVVGLARPVGLLARRRARRSRLVDVHRQLGLVGVGRHRRVLERRPRRSDRERRDPTRDRQRSRRRPRSRRPSPSTVVAFYSALGREPAGPARATTKLFDGSDGRRRSPPRPSGSSRPPPGRRGALTARRPGRRAGSPRRSPSEPGDEPRRLRRHDRGRRAPRDHLRHEARRQAQALRLAHAHKLDSKHPGPDRLVRRLHRRHERQEPLAPARRTSAATRGSRTTTAPSARPTSAARRSRQRLDDGAVPDRRSSTRASTPGSGRWTRPA